MQRLTNLQLLRAAFIVLLLVGLTVISNPFDSRARLLIFFFLIIAICGVAATVARISQRAVKNKNSIWLRPVSATVRTTVINSVVSIWLCVLGLIIFIILRKAESTKIAYAVTFFLLMGGGYGWYLQKHLVSNSLLPYGISMFGALLMILIFLAIAH